MSRTLTVEQIEAHMRAQTSQYLKEFLQLMQDLNIYLEENYTGNEPISQKGDAINIAIKILKERGEWNA
jgi:hypothetical protein